MKKYHIYHWPDSQGLSRDDRNILIAPPVGKESEYDSTYMVPEEVDENHDDDSAYVLLGFPENQPWQGVRKTLCDYEGNVFVPLKLLIAINKGKELDIVLGVSKDTIKRTKKAVSDNIKAILHAADEPYVTLGKQDKSFRIAIPGRGQEGPDTIVDVYENSDHEIGVTHYNPNDDAVGTRETLLADFPLEVVIAIYEAFREQFQYV